MITEQSENEKTISVVVCGPHQCGKSTLLGHLVYKLGGYDDENKQIDKRKMNEYRDEAAKIARSSYMYAWVSDKREERSRALSIVNSTLRIETEKYSINMIDTPGHSRWAKNMIRGVTSANVALLTVSAQADDFETNWEVTKEHALITFSLGCKTMIVVITKMDSCVYSESRYNSIKTETAAHLKKIGYKPAKINFVPISGYVGDNLIDKSTQKMPWYNGPCLSAALEALNPPENLADKPLRMPVTKAITVPGIGPVIVGNVAAGMLTGSSFAKENNKPAVRLRLGPTGITTNVRGIEKNLESLLTAGKHHGLIGASCMGFSKKDVKIGQVLMTHDSRKGPASLSLKAQVIIMAKSSKKPIYTGFSPIMHCHQAAIATTFKTFHETLDRKTGKVLEKDPRKIQKGDMCTVTLVPTKPMYVEPFDECAALGQFVMRDQNQIVAVGVIKSVEYGEWPRHTAKRKRSTSMDEDETLTTEEKQQQQEEQRLARKKAKTQRRLEARKAKT